MLSLRIYCPTCFNVDFMKARRDGDPTPVLSRIENWENKHEAPRSVFKI